MRIVIQRGGKGSGHWGHKGRPGEVGGSLPSVGPRIIIEAKVQASDASLDILPDSTAHIQGAWRRHQEHPRLRLIRVPPGGFIPGDTPWADMHHTEQAASWKATVSQALAEELGVDAALVSAVLAQWAENSGGRSYPALLFQKTASRLFGAPMQEWADDLLDRQREMRAAVLRAAAETAGETDPMRALEYVTPTGPEPFPWNLQTTTERLLAEPVEAGAVERPRSPEKLEVMVREMRGGRTEEQFLADMMRATYAATQRLLTEWGVDGVVVYRGVGLYYGEHKWLREGSTEPLGGNPLQSWTLDPGTAQNFAASGPGPRNITRSGGVVYAAYVPRERIFSLPFTGPGCLRESEIVVIGGPGEKTVAWGWGLPKD